MIINVMLCPYMPWKSKIKIKVQYNLLLAGPLFGLACVGCNANTKSPILIICSINTRQCPWMNPTACVCVYASMCVCVYVCVCVCVFVQLRFLHH